MSLSKDLKTIGYQDVFEEEGRLWGFLGNAEIPTEITFKEIDQIPRKVLETNLKGREERVAQWPNFSSREKFELLRRRIDHNKKLQGKFLQLENIRLRVEPILILGDRWQGMSCWGNHDFFSLVVSQWRNVIKRDESLSEGFEDSVDVFERDLNPSIAQRKARKGDAADIVVHCETLEEWRSLDAKKFKTWIICNCDRPFAEYLSNQTGLDAKLLWSLPGNKFWVYQQDEGRAILGSVKNRNSSSAEAMLAWKLFRDRISLRTKLIALVFAVTAIFSFSGNDYARAGCAVTMPFLLLSVRVDQSKGLY